MTSTLQVEITPDLTALTDGQTADAQDVKTPFNELADAIEAAREQVSVSATDTHWKHLEDAFEADLPIKLEVINPSGNEKIKVTLDATGVTAGHVLTANGVNEYTPQAPGGGGATPIDITVTAGEALALRDLVFLDSADNKWRKIDTDADPLKLSAFRGVVNEAAGIANDATGSVRVLGEVGGFTGLTAWADVFASATAGGYTQTKPDPSDGGSQVAIIRIGVALNTTTILVNTVPFANPCQFLKRSTLIDDATLSIKHYTDALGRLRRLRAFLSSTAPGTVLATYANSNQDVHVSLRGATGAGATLDVNQSGDTLTIGDSGGTELRMAMSFIPTAGILTTIKFTLGANVGSPTGGISWEIRNNNAGQPGATVLASGGPVAVTASTENTISVTAGPLLDGTTVYHLVLYTQAQATNSSYRWQASSGAGSYANGNNTYSNNGGSTWNNTTNDCELSIITAASTQKDKLAQSFVVSGTQTVDLVKLWLKKVGLPTGTMTLRIETDSTGSPSGTLAHANATVTVAESSLATIYGWIEFNFASDFALSGSTTYWLVLSTDRSASNINYVDWGADASAPSLGTYEMKYDTSGWNTESKDACFEVYGSATAFDSPALVASWNSGLGEVEMVAGDASLANRDTQSTLKNTKGVTVDLTLIVELD